MDTLHDSSGTELIVFRESLIQMMTPLISFDYMYFYDSYQEDRVRENSIDTYIKEKYNKKENIKITLPVLQYNNIDKIEINCTICLNEIKEKDNYYKLECLHCFHDVCIEEAVQYQHLECPLCRNIIPHRIEKNEENKFMIS